MKKKKAFSLFEFLTYLALFSCYSLYLFHFFSSLQVNLKKNLLITQKALETSLFWDMITRDIKCASPFIHEWSIPDMVFAQYHLDENKKPVRRCICYHVLQEDLYRTHGEYDFATNKWLKKATAKSFSGVQKIAGTIPANPEVEMIEITVTLNDNRVQKQVVHLTCKNI